MVKQKRGGYDYLINGANGEKGALQKIQEKLAQEMVNVYNEHHDDKITYEQALSTVMKLNLDDLKERNIYTITNNISNNNEFSNKSHNNANSKNIEAQYRQELLETHTKEAGLGSTSVIAYSVKEIEAHTKVKNIDNSQELEHLQKDEGTLKVTTM